jgi:hypothetical protein
MINREPGPASVRMPKLKGRIAVPHFTRRTP